MTSLHLIQLNGKSCDLRWELPPHGVTLDQFPSVENQNSSSTIFSSDMHLMKDIHLIYEIPSINSKQGRKRSLLNTQNLLTCAINNTVLPHNSKQRIKHGDQLQVGSAIFFFKSFENIEEKQSVDQQKKLITLTSEPQKEKYESDNTELSISLIELYPPHEQSLRPDILNQFDIDESYLTTRANNVKSNSKNTEYSKKTNNIINPQGEEKSTEENIISKLHQEFLDVIQDPKLLSSQKIAHPKNSKNVQNISTSLQELMNIANNYKDLHELISPEHNDHALTNIYDENEAFNEYEILQQDTSTSVLNLFSPQQSQNSISDSFEDIISSKHSNARHGKFKTIPDLNQREHHSAVADGLMEWKFPSKKENQK